MGFRCSREPPDQENPLKFMQPSSKIKLRRICGRCGFEVKNLYVDQTAAVKTDRCSRSFDVKRGTKQGDPLSSLLFNCVSESVMRKIKLKWNQALIGLPLLPLHTSTNTLTNLRFADDILLVATSLDHISHMISDLSTEAGRVGLQLHPDKTKILHNSYTMGRACQRAPSSVQIQNMRIEVLPTHETTKYLGKKVTFSEPHRTELESRLSQAWRKFHKLKQELTGTRYSLTDRLRLFHGTVTPTALYGCEAWTMTTELENSLRSVQRQMLRMILHAPRRRLNTLPAETQQRDAPDAHPTTALHQQNQTRQQHHRQQR